MVLREIAMVVKSLPFPHDFFDDLFPILLSQHNWVLFTTLPYVIHMQKIIRSESLSTPWKP